MSDQAAERRQTFRKSSQLYLDRQGYDSRQVGMLIDDCFNYLWQDVCHFAEHGFVENKEGSKPVISPIKRTDADVNIWQNDDGQFGCVCVVLLLEVFF